jgi:hypothetical protein
MKSNDTCHACGKPLIWATTTGGAMLGLGATPYQRGSWLLHAGNVATQTTRRTPKTTPRYRLHTCGLPRRGSHAHTIRKKTGEK